MNHTTNPLGKHPPGRWLRLFYRAPLAIYRAGGAGYEAWLGMHWILVVTRGRTTGREHAVLLDLLGETRDRSRYFVQAAYGRRADWLRNIEVSGRFEAQVADERFPARLESVENGEARRIMLAYVGRHRLYSPFVARMLGYPGRLGAPASVADWLVDRFGMLAIERLGEPPDAA